MNDWDKIVNPVTGRKVSIHGKIGKQVLHNYLYQIGGHPTEGQVLSKNISTASEKVFAKWFEKSFWDSDGEPINRDIKNKIKESKPYVEILINRLIHESIEKLKGPGAPWGEECELMVEKIAEDGPYSETLNNIIDFLGNKYFGMSDTLDQLESKTGSTK